MEFYARMTHPYEREEWTVQQLAALCNNKKWRRIAMLSSQQNEASPFKRLNAALFFTSIAVSERTVTLTGNQGTFTIDVPQSVTAADTGAYYWIKTSNANGSVFTVLIEKGAGVGTEELEVNSRPISIASPVNSVRIDYTDMAKGYSISKVFSHIAIADSRVLLHDTRYMYNNFILFDDVNDIQLNSNVLSFTDDSTESFTLAIDADTQPSLETLTVRSTGICGLTEIDARADRYSALGRLSAWMMKHHLNCNIIIDTSAQQDSSPFKLHDWHLPLASGEAEERTGNIIYRSKDSHNSKLKINAAMFSLDKTPSGHTLNVTDIYGKCYVIEYRGK